MISDIIQKNYRSVLNVTDYQIIEQIESKYSLEQVNDAINVAKKCNTDSLRYLVKVLESKLIKENKTPDWLNKEIVNEKLTNEDIKIKEDFDSFINNFRAYNKD